MRGVALSDLHLGFRAFSATEGGRNLRELDVEGAWLRAIDNTIAAEPDLITIAGDIFHNPRPSMHAVKAWRDGVRRFLDETAAVVVAILGNHDAGRTAETLSPVYIPDDLGDRFIVVGEPRRIQLTKSHWTGEDHETVAIACFPYTALGTGEAYRVAPDAAADLNILLVHAAVSGDPDGDRLPHFYGGGGALDVGREAERWDVIACGDFHEFRRLHPSRLAFYSGSIERTSSNIWPETTPKGVVVYDTDGGSLELVTHETRRVVDVRWLPATASTVNDALGELIGLDPGGVIFRAVVDGLPRHERDLIAWDLVRQVKQRAAHFQLDIRWARATRDRSTPASDAPGRRSLPAQAREFFAGEPRPVRDVALSYLGFDQEPAEQLVEAVA